MFVELEGPFCRAAFYCLVLLYNKEFGWSLSLAPWRGPLHPWSLLSDRNVFVVHGRSLDSFRMGAAMLERPAHDIRRFGDLGHTVSA